MSILFKPRFETATGNVPPGNPLFWETMVNQSDIFAANTVNANKGGPFGAQLWLFNAQSKQYILVGTAKEPEDSNAVVSKGRASAHAEAENLSPEKREQIIDFLRERTDEKWDVVQVSSGESCPSCRTKQVTFANELIERGLIEKGDFHVVFKATYAQTKRDADFNDAPFDQTFRAIRELGILQKTEGLFGLDDALKKNDATQQLLMGGELIYNPVNLVAASEAPQAVIDILSNVKDHPTAIIVRPDGSVLSHEFDKRDPANDNINMPERTAMVGALFEAARHMREEEGVFESWNLDGAKLYTNIREIGPMAYSESLWYSLSSIEVVEDFTSGLIDEMAQEIPGMGNRDLFAQVAADYDSKTSSLSVVFNGDPQEASAAHLVWKGKMAMEAVKAKQAMRLQNLSSQGMPVKVNIIDGTTLPLSELVKSSGRSSNYDGKKAEPAAKPN